MKNAPPSAESRDGLVDTSVWIGYLSNRAPYARQLDQLLSLDEVAGHELIFGELGFNFSFRLRQPGNHCSKFIEYLVPALELTALDCILHGFISNEGDFRPAVS